MMGFTYTWTPVIISHAMFALSSVFLGAAILSKAKGTTFHRITGWIWVVSMATVAGVSFWIHRPEGYSWIHGLSVFTLFALVLGVWLARTHRVQSHRKQMIGIYVGALVITGLFTLLPGRLIGDAVWAAFGLR